MSDDEVENAVHTFFNSLNRANFWKMTVVKWAERMKQCCILRGQYFKKAWTSANKSDTNVSNLWIKLLFSYIFCFLWGYLAPIQTALPPREINIPHRTNTCLMQNELLYKTKYLISPIDGAVSSYREWLQNFGTKFVLFIKILHALS